MAHARCDAFGIRAMVALAVRHRDSLHSLRDVACILAIFGDAWRSPPSQLGSTADPSLTTFEEHSPHSPHSPHSQRSSTEERTSSFFFPFASLPPTNHTHRPGSHHGLNPDSTQRTLSALFPSHSSSSDGASLAHDFRLGWGSRDLQVPTKPTEP